MKPRLVLLLLVGAVTGIIISVSGCCVSWWWQERKQYERTQQLSAAMEGLELIRVETSFGNLKISGADTTDCNVTAGITGQAPTADEAKKLAEQTQIILETEGKTLVVKAEKPHLKRNRCIAVAYDIIVPKRTGINCKTSYGDIKLANIEGDIESNTSFGDVVAENISGRVQLDTSYGDIDCKQITSSDFSAKSSFGDIETVFSDSCPPALKAIITTSYGDIDMDVPLSFAGDIAVETGFGKIRTQLPISVKGEISKSRLTGKVGEGNGSLDLKTSFGSITIR